MTFKIGDKIRYAGNTNGEYMSDERVGKIYTVREVREGDVTVEEDRKFAPYMYNLEPLMEVPEELFEL